VTHRDRREVDMAVHRATAVKICGLTRPGDAARAETVGAHYLGVILAGGPRLVDLATASAVLGAPRPGVQRVAVFGDRPLDELVTVSDRLDLDVLQLHGDPSVELLVALQRRTSRALWPVLRVEGTALPPHAETLARTTGALVLDAKVVGQLGGTGVTLDWSGLAEAVALLRRAVPQLHLVLAGGLRDDNVARAMALLEPDVVDVSSGVEYAPGLKDPSAIARFVSAVSAAKESR
jgi:phosphoribosylanthranilate isomerase